MADVDLQINFSFSPETLAAFDRLAVALQRIVPSPPPASSPSPVQPEAPGVSAPFLDVSSPKLPAEAPSRAAGAGRSTSAPRAFPRKRSPSYGWMTGRRRAILEELYPTEPEFGRVIAALAAEPGPPLPRNNVVRTRANLLGLHRPDACIGEGLRRALETSRRARASVGVPASPPAAEPPVCLQEPDIVVAVPPASAAVVSPVASTPVALDRLATIRRVAASLDKNRILPAAQKGEPKVAGQEAIRNWAAERGLQMDAFDLAAVNKKAAAIGHPGFVLREPERRRPA